MTNSGMRSVGEFDEIYHAQLPQRVTTWAYHLEMKLGKAGLEDARYHRYRIWYIREFLVQFPDERDNDDRYLTFKRAEAEAMWGIGRQAEAEAIYRALTEKFPDEAWTYIGWSAEYYLANRTTNNYEAAEAILQQALTRPSLNERAEVLARLAILYEQWPKPEKQAAVEAKLAGLTADK